MNEYSYLLQAFEETPTHMSIKINRLEEGHNSYPLVCRRPAETVSLQRRTIVESSVKYHYPTLTYTAITHNSLVGSEMFRALFHLPLVVRMGIWWGLTSGIAMGISSSIPGTEHNCLL